MHNGKIIGVQACADASRAARVAKSIAEPRLVTWLRAGALFIVESWGKHGPRGKRKVWTRHATLVVLTRSRATRRPSRSNTAWRPAGAASAAGSCRRPNRAAPATARTAPTGSACRGDRPPWPTRPTSRPGPRPTRSVDATNSHATPCSTCWPIRSDRKNRIRSTRSTESGGENVPVQRMTIAGRGFRPGGGSDRRRPATFSTAGERSRDPSGYLARVQNQPDQPKRTNEP